MSCVSHFLISPPLLVSFCSTAAALFISFPLCAKLPHLCIDHMFWQHAVVLFLLSAGPIWIPAGWSHRWTRWGSAASMADTPASPSQNGSTSHSHIRRISDLSISNENYLNANLPRLPICSGCVLFTLIEIQSWLT